MDNAISVIDQLAISQQKCLREVIICTETYGLCGIKRGSLKWVGIKS